MGFVGIWLKHKITLSFLPLKLSFLSFQSQAVCFQRTDHPTQGEHFREGLILPAVPLPRTWVGTGTDLSLHLLIFQTGSWPWACGQPAPWISEPQLLVDCLCCVHLDSPTSCRGTGLGSEVLPQNPEALLWGGLQVNRQLIDCFPFILKKLRWSMAGRVPSRSLTHRLDLAKRQCCGWVLVHRAGWPGLVWESWCVRQKLGLIFGFVFNSASPRPLALISSKRERESNKYNASFIFGGGRVF